MVELDLLDETRIWFAVQTCDYVIDCALPSQGIESTVKSLQNLLKACAASMVKRFVFTSCAQCVAYH